MKYINADKVLPSELLEEIQKYVQGECLYIPRKDKQIIRSATRYRVEIEKRNASLYTMHLEGMSNRKLAENFSLSESSVRRIIIAERKNHKIMREKIKTLLPCWNMEDQSLKQIYSTVWQAGEGYVIKVYSDHEALKRNVTINLHLQEMGITVGKLRLTPSGEQYVERDGYFFAVSEKLQGSNIVSLKFGNRIGEQMGRIIAELHLAFGSLEDKIELWENSLLDEMKGWVKESFVKSCFKSISAEEYERVLENLDKFYGKLPAGLIHRDVHFGNFLFDNKRFSGYIDFDLSQKNIRIFDLCYFVTSVLSQMEKFEITEEKWFSFAENVFAGYGSVIPLTEEEKQSAVFVMKCIQLLFLAYFEGQDDSAAVAKTYEIFSFLHNNERRISKMLR